MDFLIGFLFQMISSAGVIFIFGLFIALLRRGFCALCGSAGPKILLATGIIGTPIHELSHALMCIIFGHRITEIKLYQPNSQDGSLGYVSHTYNRRNVYHQIGNFFIGIAPVTLGGLLLLLLMMLLLPDAADTFLIEAEVLNHAALDQTLIGEYFGFLLSSVAAIFSKETFTSWQGWLFIVLAIMITTHMEMSLPDIKSSLIGLVFLSLLLLIVDAALYFIFPSAFSAFNDAIMSFGLILSAFLSLSLLFLTAILLVALIIRGIMSIFGH